VKVSLYTQAVCLYLDINIMNDSNNNNSSNEINHNPFASQSEQDNNDFYSGPQVSHSWGGQVDEDAEWEIYEQAHACQVEDFESNVKAFAATRGIKYAPNHDGIKRLYFAWLKAFDPNHGDLDFIGH